MRTGAAGDDREGAAALDPVHLERGPGPEPLERGVAGLSVQGRHADLPAVGLLVERDAPEGVRGRAAREWHDVVVEARDRDRAVGRVQARDDRGERVVRILDGAAVAARVEVGARAGDDQVEREQPFGRDRDRRLARPPHRPVGGDHEVGRELVAVGLAERRGGEGLPISSSPSNRKRTLSGSAPALGVERLGDLQGDEHRPLVVGRAAGVDAAVAHGRLERRRLPLRLVSRRLHVVVAVDENRRRPWRSEPLGEHDGVAAGLDDAAAGEVELLHEPRGRGAHRIATGVVAADARDLEEARQLAQVALALVKRGNDRHRSRSPAR